MLGRLFLPRLSCELLLPKVIKYFTWNQSVQVHMKKQTMSLYRNISIEKGLHWLKSWLRFTKRFTNHYGSRVKTECLYRFGDPVSPALAARLAQDEKGGDVRWLRVLLIHVCVLLIEELDISTGAYPFGWKLHKCYRGSYSKKCYKLHSKIAHVRRNGRR